MPTSLKTVEYHFGPSNPSPIASGAVHSMTGPANIHIPETIGRVIKSAFIVMCARTTATTSLTAFSATLVLNGASQVYSRSISYANTGEQQSILPMIDVTAQFVSQFASGTFRTISLSGTLTGSAGTICGMKLVVTYEYDTAATTRIKTVRIPIQSIDADIASTSPRALDDIPALNTFLPEAGKVFRSIALELWGNDGSTLSPSGVFLGLSVDGAASTNIMATDNSANSAMFHMIVAPLNSIDTATTHTVSVTHSSTAILFRELGGFLVVTYEYDHAASTRIMNSILTAVDDVPGYLGATTVNDRSRFERNLRILEPGQIVMERSAMWLTFNLNVDRTITMKSGNQAYKTYSPLAGSTTCGGFSIVHRIDAGSAQGAAMTLQRGDNTLQVSAYANNLTNGVSNCSILAAINYISDKSPDGDHEHNQTRMFLLKEPEAQSQISTKTFAPAIPEDNYWISGVSIWLAYSLGTAAGGFAFLGEWNDNEPMGAGWFDIYNSLYQADNERSNTLSFMTARTAFKRHDGDPDPSRVDIEAQRRYRFQTTVTSVDSWMMAITYHTMTWTIAGTISGGAGDGSGIEVELFRADTDEKFYQTTTGVGGSYSLDVHDNIYDYYVSANQNGERVGRSGIGKAA